MSVTRPVAESIQAVLGREIEPATIQPEIQLDLWALTTLIDLQLDGYVLIGG